MFTPTGITNKWTTADQPIVFEGRGYVIPRGTRISNSATAVHFNPKVWGDDTTKWEPSRWIIEDRRPTSSIPSAGSAVTSGTTSANGLLVPGKSTFLPFSDGARACLGKRVATIEFVAVIFTLLREHRVEFEEGWSKERVKKVLTGRKARALTLQPPEPIPLRFVRRQV
jgi:cytochrome P450